jgi:DNA mismatch repair protein MutS2
MDKHTIRVLEYEKVLGLVARYAATEAGGARIVALAPLDDASEVSSRLKMISEMKSLMEWDKSVPLAGVSDVREAVSRAKVPGAVLDARMILLIGSLARTSRLVFGFFRDNKEKAKLLWKMTSDLRELRDLERQIDAAIDEDTNIKDGASEKLKRIRREKVRVSARISSALSDILARENLQPHLQDSIVTIRNGRYVVPVRAEAKSKLEGIVHDTSHSGATVFIEPMKTVTLNNTLRSLQLEEKDEIVRILAALTDSIGSSAGDLIGNLGILTELDVIRAGARFSKEFDCSEPSTNREGRTTIKGGRHPILVEMQRSGDGGAAVPMDMAIGQRGRGVLITGPNAGGKTVALKTIGILTLLARTGFHIPCDDGTDIGLFGKVYADIGDEQSIELSLSTFSSHMKNIIAILDNADSDALVLLDEVGAGTDPSEGAALAHTVIEELLRKDAALVATTHHLDLKIFAHENPRLENASMEFDSENLKPTYRLIQGIPGASHAFEIASRLGLDDSLLERARAHCGGERVRFEELTRDLLEKMRKLAVEEAGIEAKSKEVDDLMAEYERMLDELKRQDREMKRQALKEAKSVVDDAKRTVTKLVKELKQKQPPPHEAREIEKRIREKAGRIDEAIEEMAEALETRVRLKTITVGARAYVKPLSREGTILSEPDEHGRVEVVVGPLRVEVAAADLFEAGAPAPEKHPRVFEFEARQVPSEIDVRGMTAEDAWEVVDKYLDDAALYGYDSVRIIHGKGKGILARKIREMLVSHPGVKSHRFGDIGEGGTGVTIVGIERG